MQTLVTGCFQFGGIMNAATINSYMQFFELTSIFIVETKIFHFSDPKIQ